MVIGLPVSSFIASAVSLQITMVFFAVLNALVFIATLLFVPSLPITKQLSYGTQLSDYKNSYMDIHSHCHFNKFAIFVVYSYLTEYLNTVTNMSSNTIGLMLIIFGGVNIIGNIVEGKLLTKNAMKYIVSFSFHKEVSTFYYFSWDSSLYLWL
jgi:MFS transporter, DHA1 family, inner membrane transport protein